MWTGGLPHLSGLPHLPVVPTSMYTGPQLSITKEYLTQDSCAQDGNSE